MHERTGSPWQRLLRGRSNIRITTSVIRSFFGCRSSYASCEDSSSGAACEEFVRTEHITNPVAACCTVYLYVMATKHKVGVWQRIEKSLFARASPGNGRTHPRRYESR